MLVIIDMIAILSLVFVCFAGTSIFLGVTESTKMPGGALVATYFYGEFSGATNDIWSLWLLCAILFALGSHIIISCLFLMYDKKNTLKGATYGNRI